MSINSVNNVGSSLPVQKLVSTPVSKPDSSNSSTPSSTDRVELSGTSPALQSNATNDVRAAKIASIKAQIEAGTYEDDAKINAATDKLLNVLNPR